MKQYFYFYFDQSGTLCCINEYMYHEKLLKAEKAVKALDITNYINFKKIVVKDNKMSLYSNHNHVIIDDIDTFYRKKYINILSNVKRIINCSFRYNLVKDDNYQGLSVDNMTFYTANYKRKLAVKSGRVFVLSGFALASSFVMSKEIDNMQKQNDILAIVNDLEKVNNSLTETEVAVDKYISEMEQEEEIIEEEKTKKDYTTFSSYNDETKYAYDNFYDIVYANASATGVDPNLVMAMLIQESRGKKANLMQISYGSWTDNVLEYYDFETEEYKKFVLTNNKGKYDSDIECVDYEDFQKPENNVKAGCLILRESIKHMDNNIMAGVQCYNLGTGNMDRVMSACVKCEDISKEDLLSDQDNMLFTSYTKYASGGDKRYIANVSQFLNDEDSIYYLDIDTDGNINEYNHSLKEKEKVYTK